MNILTYTNKGSRKVNQDYLITRSLSADSAIFVLADGMGGYSHGDIAAQTIADSILEYIEKNLLILRPIELIREAIIYSNEALLMKKLECGGKKMGAVISVLLIINNRAYISWLGDSRVYLFRDGNEVYRTEDHSVINELSKTKSLTASNIKKYASVVTKSVMGYEEFIEIPINYIKIQPNDCFILCTDGLYKEIGVDLVRELKDSQFNILDKKAHLISDNFSFIKVEI